MSKIIVIGDLHGSSLWKDIIKKENPDLTIMLGDYVSSYNIPERDQIYNLNELLNYKEKNPDKIILLRGNHDLQHLGYSWAQMSGMSAGVRLWLMNNKDRFLKNSQWIYVYNNIIFSHAGISEVWMKNNEINSIDEINSMEPSEVFGFISDSLFDRCGTSKWQSLTWIRPQQLCQCNIKGYDQVVGHTNVEKIINLKQASKGNQNIWLCDCLQNKHPQYLKIEDKEITPISYI